LLQDRLSEVSARNLEKAASMGQFHVEYCSEWGVPGTYAGSMAAARSFADRFSSCTCWPCNTKGDAFSQGARCKLKAEGGTSSYKGTQSHKRDFVTCACHFENDIMEESYATKSIKYWVKRRKHKERKH
jgi:hypothetical protein